ncbi:MAG: flagellar biosynthesis protein FlhA [Alphaproteobacteria bacterium]|nr:flagellar biosynthesis protein FlhA [Alphaproteobacteria bacterium]
MTDSLTEAAATTEAGSGAGTGLRGRLLALPAFERRGEIALAVGLICILIVLLLPMPTWMLDFSLALSITFSVVILMTVLFIRDPLELNTFPTILLVATMLRLALNLASTRLILADGYQGPDAAGHVIEAFGSFVVGGNYVIGIIVFAILVIVNFVVITKGAGRIAEVAARFSLDAMPGKQMAIDADLSAGLINEDQARERRQHLEEESAFYGSMDGASKFVRGDAIAGLLITFINIVGGIIIGTAQQDMKLGEAVQTYTLLTVGDGLVTQIPALIVSTAAGMLVTMSGTAAKKDSAVFGQLGSYPTALGLCALLLLCISVLPGIPMLPFVILAATTGAIAYHIFRREADAAAKDREVAAAEEAALPVAEEPISTALQIDSIRLELGYGLLSLINNPQERRLTDQIKALRRQLAMEMGFVMPAVRIQDNLQLPPNQYVVRIKEIESGVGELQPNNLLIMDPRGETISLAGEATTEPTFGLPAMWISERLREEATFRGYTVVDAPTVATTHLTELIRDNMAELLSYSETQKLLDDLDKPQQKLIADLIPNQVTVSGLQRVLQNLLSERVSIRDLPTILEGVSEASGFTRNITQITEHVRARLSRQLSNAATNDHNFIPLVTLSPEWEQAFAESIVGEGDDRQLAMAPSTLQDFITAVRTTFERQAMQGETPVLLVSPGIRAFVRSVIERFRPVTVVMSQNEIHPKAKIKTMDQI